MDQETNETAGLEPDDRSLERDIEALLFATESPLSAARLAGLTGSTSTRRVLTAIGTLSTFYRESNRSFTVVEVAGGYQLATLPEFAGTVSLLFKGKKKSRLTQPALETLAIVAYKQPIGRMQIEAIRGVNCEGVLATLVEREIVTISGRGEGVGKPYLYSTTKKFLEYLGLKDFRDLPSFEELERRFALEEGAAKPLIPPPAASPDPGGSETSNGQ